MRRDNIDKEYAITKISSQFDLEEKVKNSDYVIDNSNSKEETIEIVKKVLELLKE